MLAPIPVDQTSASRRTVDVAVVGAGITGAATAHALASTGVDVLLIDRLEPSSRASGANAGSLHAQIQHEPFCTLGEEWARAFLPALRLLVASVALWRTLPDRLGADLHVSTAGGLLLAGDNEQLAQIERKTSLEQSAGLPVRMLGRDELREVAPYASESMVGGALCEAEGKADALTSTQAYVAAAIAAGASLALRTLVTGIEQAPHGQGGVVLSTTGGEIHAARVVLAPGADAPALLALLGVHLPMSADAMQVTVTEAVAPVIPHLVYFAGARLTVKQSHAGSILIGGGWPARLHPDGFVAVDPAALASNLAVACEVVPRVSAAAVLRTWGAVNNGVADQLPVIGEVAPNVFFATFPYLGFTAGPVMGELLAALVNGDEPQHDVAPFTPERFR